MKINKTATAIRHVLMTEADDGLGMGSGGAAQDVESRIMNALNPGDDGANQQDDVDVQDDKSLSDDIDTDIDGDADSDDSDADGSEEDEDPDAEEDDDLTLAGILGIDEDKLDYNEEGDVVFKTVVNGEESEVPLNELVKSYQLQGHVNNKSIALQNERKEFEQNRDEVYTQLTGRVETVNKLIEVAEQQILSEFQGIDWDGLRMSDPAEWSALRQQAAERVQQLDQLKSQVGQIGNELTEEQKAELTNKQNEFVKGEFEKMVIDNPEWADETVMAKDFADIGNFLQTTYGFTPEEVAGSLDARLMRMIRDVQKYHNGTKKVKEKKVDAKTPKFRKPGQNSKQRAALQKARDQKAKKQQLRRSGSTKDVAAIIADRL